MSDVTTGELTAGDLSKGPLPARRKRCVVGRCARSAIPTWPWCEEHRPRFDGPQPRGYWPERTEDRAREAVRRWPDWDDEAIAAAAGVGVSALTLVRTRMGLLRSHAF